MTNKEISAHFNTLSKLMEIHGENPFRARTYSVAAFRISQLDEELQTLSTSQIGRINGIGASMANLIEEIIQTGQSDILEELFQNTPEGILEMMRIKGIGSKKIHVIWKEMGIESVAELLLACQENRLLRYSGFGQKTQQNIQDAIEYYLSNLGNYLYAQLEPAASMVSSMLQKKFGEDAVQITGDFARQEVTADKLELIIQASEREILTFLNAEDSFADASSDGMQIQAVFAEKLDIRIYPAEASGFLLKEFETTGPEEFVNAFFELQPHLDFTNLDSSEQIFSKSGMQYIPPFLRDAPHILQKAAAHQIPDLIVPTDIKGIIHCHSNWSDGSNTIEELAEACMQAGMEYLVLSDHSQSATYAQGLTEERVAQQHRLIDSLNKTYKPFRIFKSIESDILGDGSLDYSDAVLQTFDLVIASVHSNLKMTQERAMERLLKAIENPFTTILGHMTGRLLLSREGYPVDYKKIIDACAANRVVIEINANPRRLDMRWQWIEYALSKNVLLSINPDAHSIPEFENTKYGVLAAQKGMLTARQNLSSFSLSELEAFLTNK